jgi:type IV pilus assembly protein PilC
MNQGGRTVRGTMAAVNEDDLASRLSELSLDLISLRPVKAATLIGMVVGRLRAGDVVQFCVHMEHMMHAGVSLVDCLADVRDATEAGRFRDTVSALHSDVRDGAMLSVAVSRHPGVFDGIFLGLVRAGEETGNLELAFAELARHIRWREDITGRIRMALRYPLILGLLMLIILALMMGYVVPSVVGYLREIDMELPLLTRSLIAVSDFIVAYWPWLVTIPALAVVGAMIGMRVSPPFALAVDRLKLRLPLIGPVLRKMALSRFTHFFSVMFRGGVPILGSLETASGVVGNREVSGALSDVAESVSGGRSLANALDATGVFPSLVVRMVRVGEDSGKLMETLDNVTQFYDRDVNDSVSDMIASIEPAVTIFLGVLMIWIATAVLGPIYNSFGSLG